jgi:hypothetical protein
MTSAARGPIRESTDDNLADDHKADVSSTRSMGPTLARGTQRRVKMARLSALSE